MNPEPRQRDDCSPRQIEAALEGHDRNAVLLGETLQAAAEVGCFCR